MAYQVTPIDNVLMNVAPGSFLAIPGTLTNTGIVANADGRKIVPAGTALESNSTGSILTNGDAAKACTDYTGAQAEAILNSDVDVTDGNVATSFLIAGRIDGALCPDFKYGSIAALKANGIFVEGGYTQESSPILTFAAVASAAVGATKIASVTPTLGDGHSYVVAVDEALPPVGTDLTDNADWTAYTLGNDITADTGDVISLVEIDGDGVVVKGGLDACVAGALPPVLTFVCADHADEGKTQIATVDPVATGANTYMVAVGDDVDIPAVGADLTGVSGWAAYTLTAGIVATNEELITLCEVSTGDIVVKAGSAAAVVA